MEKIKKVTVKDLDGQKLSFSIRLFDALDGLDFVDRYVTSKDKSIKPFLADWLNIWYRHRLLSKFWKGKMR